MPFFCQSVKKISLFIFFFFKVCALFSQVNIDSFFTLKDYHQTAAIDDYLWSNTNNPELINKMGVLIYQKGTASNKLMLAHVRERMTYPDSLYTKVKLIALSEKYIPLAQKLNDHYLVANLFFSISERYAEQGQFNKSFEYKLYCMDELKKDPSNNYYEQQWYLHLIAAQYYQFKDYKKAIELSKIASTFNGRYSPNDVWLKKVNSNLVGMAYLKDGNYDSAFAWLEKTKNLAIADKDTAWMGIATGNIGMVKMLKKNFVEAIIDYEQALPLCQKFGLWDNVMAFTTDMAKCDMQLGNMQTAILLINKTKEIIPKAKPQINFIFNQINYYSTVVEYYRRVGNTAAILQNTDSLVKYQKQEEKEFDIIKKTQDEAQLAYKNKELEAKVVSQKLILSKLLLYSIVIAFILITAIALLFFKRQKLRYLLKQEQLEHEKDIASEELKLANIELRDFTILIWEKNEMLEKFVTEIEMLKQQQGNQQENNVVNIEALRQSAILTEDDWLKFKKLFEKVHPGFVAKLKVKYTDLTTAETRFLMLTKLKLSPKEMCAMLGVGAEAIRNLRFRIRKKLNLEDGNELDELVNNI